MYEARIAALRRDHADEMRYATSAANVQRRRLLAALAAKSDLLDERTIQLEETRAVLARTMEAGIVHGLVFVDTAVGTMGA